VTSVERLTNNWQVTVEDLKTKKLKTEYYDVVMVCNGHNAMPFIPDIPGKDDFEGIQIHSHDYRIPEHFTNMNVLIIGSGPSGTDICLDVSKVANQVNEKYLVYNKLVSISYILSSYIKYKNKSKLQNIIMSKELQRTVHFKIKYYSYNLLYR